MALPAVRNLGVFLKPILRKQTALLRTVRTVYATRSQYNKATVTVHFLFPDGRKKTVEAKQGSNLLDVVIDHSIDIDGYGACEGTLACSTCHIILPQDVYRKLDPPCDEEQDMLDLAYGLTDTSRLGCQVILTKDLDGLEVTVPAGLADARS